MAFGGKELEDITPQDILDLLSDKTPEDVSLDYKREPWKRDKPGTEELIKDVSAMANSQGGHIVVGIPWKKDSEGREVPKDHLFSVANASNEAESIRDRCRKHIDPPILDFDVKIVRVSY